MRFWTGLGYGALAVAAAGATFGLIWGGYALATRVTTPKAAA
jgi:hypothetical protein